MKVLHKCLLIKVAKLHQWNVSVIHSGAEMVRKQWMTCLTIAKNYRGDKIGKAIIMDSGGEPGWLSP